MLFACVCGEQRPARAGCGALLRRPSAALRPTGFPALDALAAQRGRTRYLLAARSQQSAQTAAASMMTYARLDTR